LILFINTATTNNELFLINSEKIIARKNWQSRRDESDKLLANIKLILSENKMNFGDLSKLVIVTGPGGFTSVRVGVTVANALSYALSIPILGIKLFDYWQIIKSGDVVDYLLVHSATRKDVFVEGVGEWKNVFPEFKIYDFKNFVEKIQSLNKMNVNYLGELMPDHAQVVATINSHYLTVNFTNLVSYLAMQNFELGKIIEPFYGRMGQVAGKK